MPPIRPDLAVSGSPSLFLRSCGERIFQKLTACAGRDTKSASRQEVLLFRAEPEARRDQRHEQLLTSLIPCGRPGR